MRIPKEEYASLDALNNSRLGLISVSPYLFFNPQPREDRDYFTIGTIVNDFLLLTPEEIDSKYYSYSGSVPPKKLKEFAEALAAITEIEPTQEQLRTASSQVYTTKYKFETLQEMYSKVKDYKEAIPKMAGKIVVDTDDYTIYRNISDSLKTNPLAYSLLTTGESEQAFTWELLGKPCKGLLDKIEINHENKEINITDFKTTADNPFGTVVTKGNNPNPYTWRVTGFLTSVLHKYDYLRQLSWYCLGVQENFPEYKINLFIVVAGKQAPFDTAVYKISPSALNYGVCRCYDYLNLVLKHEASGNFTQSMTTYETGIHYEL